MGLQARAQKFETLAKTPGQGLITDAREFTNGIHAKLADDNTKVRLIMHGNVSGFSPAYLCVDSDGLSAWVPQSELRITDPNYLPMQDTTKNAA